MTMPHPDDEQLSAHLDGEAGADVAAHVAGCAECAARIGDLDRIVAAVAAPVAPAPSHVRDRAVAAALAVWDGAGAVPDGGSPAPSSAAAAAAVTRRPLPRWMAAAAVLVVVALAALPFLRTGDDASVGNEVATDVADGSEAAGKAGAGDLGDVEDEAALNSALAGVLGVESAFATSEPLAADADAGQAGASAGGGDDSQDALTAAGGSTRRSATSLASCRAEAAAYAGSEHSVFAYSASLRWKSRPAYVYVFLRSDSGQELSRRAVVVDQAACALLVVQSF